MSEATESIDLGADEGRLKVTLAGQTKVIDVWEVNNRLHEFHKAKKSAPADVYSRGLAEVVEQCGFPGVSSWLAEKFAALVAERTLALQKKSGWPAGSPASTEDSTSPG